MKRSSNPHSSMIRLGSGLILAALVASPIPRSALAAGPAAPVVAEPAPLSATLTGMAKAEYEGGKILFVDRDYANALLKFEHALEISRDPRLLWNIASCEKSLRHYTRVLTLLDRYQREGGALLTEQDRKDAMEIIAIVKGLVGTLRVMVSEPEAEVFVDDQRSGLSPVSPVLVDVGTRKIRVKKAGWKPFEQQVAVAGAGEVVVEVKLEREVHQGRLIVEAGAKDRIAIDGKMVGLGRWEGAIASGGHALKVTAPGMAAYQSEVVIQDDKERRIPVTLNPLPGSIDKATWIWIAGGAVLTAGAIVGSVFLFRPTETPAQGTIGTFPLSFGGKR